MKINRKRQHRSPPSRPFRSLLSHSPGGMMSLAVKSKTKDSVKCEVIDGGELKSRRHLNVRGNSATLPSITDKDWEDIKFGVDNKVDFYAVSFVKDANVVHELKDYLRSCNADIHVIVKIESADSIPNLHSILTASDGHQHYDRLLEYLDTTTPFSGFGIKKMGESKVQRVNTYSMQRAHLQMDEDNQKQL